MQTVAQWLVANPAMQAIVVGILTAVLVQGYKWRWKLPPGDPGLPALKKRAAALVAPVLLALLTQVAAGQAMDWGQIATVAVSAWFGAQGVHAMLLRSPVSKAPGMAG